MPGLDEGVKMLHKEKTVHRLMQFLRPFLFLTLFTTIGIFLHELGHHLLGVPSMMSLARNWPLVPVTAENRQTEIVGTLAGPSVNLLLGYSGLLVYKISRREGFLRFVGLYCGLANSFLVFVATLVNLIVDFASGNWANDLQKVSKLMDTNVLILPTIYFVLSTPALMYFWLKRVSITQKRATFTMLLLGAWLFGGAFLMLLDAVFHIRFKIV